MRHTCSAYIDVLNDQKAAGLVTAWWFQPTSLRIQMRGEGLVYFVPDFMVLTSDGVTHMDVIIDADNQRQRVVAKAAADHFPAWVFRTVERQPDPRRPLAAWFAGIMRKFGTGTSQTKGAAGGWKVMEV